MDNAWPPDLPEADERQLISAGRRLLIADVTGEGRAAFPSVFPATQRSAVRPGFTRVRIQAAIARTDPAQRERAVVHLVWAGADRGGTYTDGRLSDITFLHTPHPTNGAAWTPSSLS